MQYVNNKKDFQEEFLEYIEKEEGYDPDYSCLIEILEKNLIPNKPEEIRALIHFIKSISENHRRNETFFSKIEQVFIHFKDQIKEAFSNNRLFNHFIDNKRILLILFTDGIITMNEYIYNFLIKSDFDYQSYFYPEIKSFTNNGKEKLQEIEKKNIEIDQQIFDEKRKIGENDSYICSLIRDDIIIDFIVYITQTNYPLKNSVPQSIFETNTFLNKKNVSLIEYAAFFGSIQIFRFLIQNEVEMTPSLWLYAIHSDNAELIHILENNELKFSSDTHINCIIESIKCHHNHFANYFINNLPKSSYYSQSIIDKKILENIFCYYNYAFFPKELVFNEHTTNNLFRYDYEELVKPHLEVSQIKKSFLKLLLLAMKENNIEITMNILLSLEGIEKDSFCIKNECELTEFKIPSFVTSINQIYFKNISSLTKITIPESVTHICERCFEGCKLLTEAIFPQTIKTIGNCTFNRCTSLKTFKIPESVESIGDNCFMNCSALEEIIIPDSVKIIGDGCFSNCSSLTYVKLSRSIRIISQHCFEKCCSLPKLIIPESVNTISKAAFKSCTKLSILSIPFSLMNLSPSSIFECRSLKEIGVYSANGRPLDRDFFKLRRIKFVEIAYPFENNAHDDNFAFDNDFYDFYDFDDLIEFDVDDFDAQIKDNFLLFDETKI